MKISRHRILAAAAAAFFLTTAAMVPSLHAQGAPPELLEAQSVLALVSQNKWAEAQRGALSFLDKYKDSSPVSRDIRYLLALAYINQPNMHDQAIAELKRLIPDEKTPADIKDQAMLLVAKAYTMKGAALSAGDKTREAAFGEAVKAYDAYVAAYPNSTVGDTAFFLSAALTLDTKQYEEAVRRFGVVYSRYAQSPLRIDALLNIGKIRLIQAGDLLSKKEPKPAEIDEALDIYQKKALPALTQIFRDTTDAAILNEAQYYIGHIRFAQSQHIKEADADKRKKLQEGFLFPALDAYRAVRTVDEVLATQDAKIAVWQDTIGRLNRLDRNYLANKSYFENLIEVENDKKEKLKTGADQYVAARLAVARIFLTLQKYDECRTLLHYLLGQSEFFAKEKDKEASTNAMLVHTYIGQRNLAKAHETFLAFREKFKGDDAGADLPLVLSNLAVDKGDVPLAEQIVKQAMEDYTGNSSFGGWQYAGEAVRVLIRVALRKGEYAKALELCEEVLSKQPKPEVELDTLYVKGTVQEQMAQELKQPEEAKRAIDTYQIVRDRFGSSPRAEDAWFRQTQILAGLDPAKAIPEIEAYIKAFSEGGKSDETKTNVVISQSTLGQVLSNLNQADKAAAMYRKVIEENRNPDLTPDIYFRLVAVEQTLKNSEGAIKLMEEFITKYPNNRNIYFAYSTIAEILYLGSGDGKSSPVAALEAGAKKLMEYVDYEIEKKLEPQRGENALIKMQDKWTSQMSTFGNYTMLNAQKQGDWKQCAEGVLAAVEKQLQSYPRGERLPEALERAVRTQLNFVKNRVVNGSQAEAYFRDLLAKYGTSNEAKARLMGPLITIVAELDPKRASALRREAYVLAPAPIQRVLEAAHPDKTRPVPTFGPTEWDGILGDLHEQGKLDEVSKSVVRIRTEYASGQDGFIAPAVAEDALAVALFWEGKVLESQGKIAEAGAKFAELARLYPSSTKRMEADYGTIAGKLAGGTLKTESEKRAAIRRLSEIVANSKTKNFDIQAKSLLLIGRIYEEMQEYDAAVGAYAKVADRFGGVQAVAADGLWRAAVILDRQANKELPVRVLRERQEAANKAKEINDALKKEEQAVAAANKANKAAAEKAAKAPTSIAKNPENPPVEDPAPEAAEAPAELAPEEAAAPAPEQN